MFIETILLVIIGLVITLINDIIFRPLFPQFNITLRYLDHLFAGVGVTILIYCFFRLLYDIFLWRVIRVISNSKVKAIFHSNIFMILFSCILSLYAAFHWEYYQLIQRGYLQYDQLIVDFIGVLIFLILFSKFKYSFINNTIINRNVLD